MRSRHGQSTLAVAAGLLIAGLAALPLAGLAQPDDLEAVLGGFDDDEDAAAEDGALGDVLGGFEDDAPESEVDDALAGFDDESEDPEASQQVQEPARRIFELTGNASLGASYNTLPHYASLGPSRAPLPPAQNGSYYGNLQRLRLRGDLQLDLFLPHDWKLRGQGYGFYDFAYLIHGRDAYTNEVLRDYEYEFKLLDLWLQGSVTSWLDLKLGRQVVNWGRSDTLRVNDVLNPLNNREPGLADIEDLRLPVTMAKADFFWRAWRLSAIVIPEIRYDDDPPPGSDFYPDTTIGPEDLAPLPPIPIPPPLLALIPPATLAAFEAQFAAALGGRATSAASEPPQRQVNQWGSTPEYAGSLTGIFSGWDLSFYVSRTYQNRTSTVVSLPTFASQPIYSDDDRVTSFGAGGNYTVGSWLLKAEIAYLDELDYLALRPDWSRCPVPQTLAELQAINANPTPLLTCVPYAAEPLQKSRLDSMLGVEYYGVNDVTVALEAAYRHLFDYDPLLGYLPNYVYEHNLEAALRISTDMMNARLRVMMLGLVLVNDSGFFGSTLRVSADYDLMDAVVVSGGWIYFVGSQQVPFDTWVDNDRFFMKIKYSF